MKNRKLKEQEVKKTTILRMKSGATVPAELTPQQQQDLKDNPDITGMETGDGKRIKENISFSEQELKIISQEISLPISEVLEELGDEVVKVSAEIQEENSFILEITFAEGNTKTYKFYVVNDKLILSDDNRDVTVGDIGLTPSGKPLINKTYLKDRLTRYFKTKFLQEKELKNHQTSEENISGKKNTRFSSNRLTKEDLLKRIRTVLEEMYDIELNQDPETKEFSRRLKLTDKDKESLRKLQILLNKEKQSRQLKQKPVDSTNRNHMKEDLDIGHQDDEPAMIKQALYDIATYATKLYKQLNSYDSLNQEVDFPSWWQAKISSARDYISSAQHYLEYYEVKPALDMATLQEQKATCCGRCGRVHVKGSTCKKPYLSKTDPKHCSNKK